ncbi:energy transducer TonB [Thalassobellus sediminis]|uniref:energy transducer TonB n=1 Tax=Thalassobellus sediminis TaxID=3367753 RepID=UPI00379B9CBC
MKKSQKHDANLQKNSTLYFQVGLIVCLLAAYGLLEMKFETRISKYGDLPPIEIDSSISIPIIKPEVKVVNEPVEQKVKAPTEKFIEVPDTTPDIFITDTSDPILQSDPVLKPTDVIVSDEPKEIDDIPVAFIQNVPVYPGCENKKSNDDKRKCLSQKITKLIQRKFDGSDIASDYGLSGRQKIDVQFTVDKTGRVTNIKTRSPHPKLDEEAERVINMIPEMTPGKQNNKNVGVLYSIPIVFQVQN